MTPRRRNGLLAWTSLGVLAAGVFGGLALLASALIAWALTPGWAVTGAEAARAAAGLLVAVAGSAGSHAMVRCIRPADSDA